MKHYIISAIAIISFFAQNALAFPIENTGKTSISGSVIDSKTKEPLPAVTIYFPEIKSGALTDDDGNFSIQNLPMSRLTVQVSLIGYEAISKVVDLKSTNSIKFELSESITEISEIVITGQPGVIEQKRTPAPISVVPKTELLENTSTNIRNNFV